MTTLRSLLTASILLLIIIVCSGESSGPQVLKQVIFVMKEANRSPLLPLEADETYWDSKAGGNGELTSKGAHQSQRVGSYYRDHYDKESNFLPMNDFYRSVYFRAVDQDRTLLTSQAFLLGLYGNVTAPIIPVFAEATDRDYLLRSPLICSRYQRHLADVTFTDTFRSKEEKAEGLLEYLSDFFDQEVNLTSFSDVYDAVESDLSNGREILPAASSDIGGIEALSADKIEEMRDLADWLFSVAFQPQFGKEVGGVLIGDIITRMQACITQIGGDTNKECLERFVGYFGHDSTLASILSALGVEVDKLPPDSSQIVFELLYDSVVNVQDQIPPNPSEQNLGDGYYVRVFYNYEETKMWSHMIKLGCSAANSDECGFREFAARYEEKIVLDPIRVCVIDYTREIIAYTIVALFGLLVSFTIVGVILTLRRDPLNADETAVSDYYQQDDEDI